MSMFNCDKCNYFTEKKSNFDRHVKKHQKNNIFPCEYCKAIYEIQNNYVKHLKLCPGRKSQIDNMKKQLKEKEDLLKKNEILLKRQKKETKIIIKQKDKEKDNIIKQKDKQIEDEKKFFIRIIDSAGMAFKEVMSPLKFADNNLYYAPQMVEYSNFTFLEVYSTPDLAVEAIIGHFNKGTLHKFLGDEIVNEYVKKDPRDQSVWNSDTNRSTYLNRVLIIASEDGECIWTIDKKGIKTIQCLIDPLIKHIKDMLDIYHNKLGDLLKSKNPDFVKYESHGNAITRIYDMINDGTLKANVLKYINGFFYLDQQFTKKNNRLIANHKRNPSKISK